MTRKVLSVFLSLLLVLSLLVGCGAKAGNDSGVPNENLWGGVGNDEAAGSSGSMDVYGDSFSTNAGLSNPTADSTDAGISVGSDRKLIRTVDIEARSDKYDEFIVRVRESVLNCGGYVERASENTPTKTSRFASMLLRIPVGETDGVLELIGTLGSVTKKTEQMSDVTLQYVDTQSRLKALRAEETSLLTLLESAGSVSDIISLQDRLSSVRYQIESCESTLRKYDNQVEYSTVSLYVTESVEPIPEKEPTMWEEMGINLADGMEKIGIFFRNLFVAVVSALPYVGFFVLIPSAVVFLAVFLPVRRSIKKKRSGSKAEEPSQE